jgi:hypothetical protein
MVFGPEGVDQREKLPFDHVVAHSSTALRSQAMHPPPPAQRPPSEDRDWRGQTTEETMSIWTVSELMELTRDELCEVASLIKQKLAALEADSLERVCALASLENIRRVVVRRGLYF